MELLKIENITKSFGRTNVLSTITFSLEEGQFGCLLGSSGSGKSTLLRIIAGIEMQDSGNVILNNEVISGNSTFVKPEKRGIGMIFQDYALFPHLTVQKNILFGIGEQTVNNSSLKKLIDILELGDLLNRYPHELSGGQQQRVAIARTLAVNPKLILMDEPFSNLDEWLKEEVRDKLKIVLKEFKSTILFVTHNAMDALNFADKIMILEQGNILQEGSIVEIIDNPKNAKVAGIFGKVNQFSSIELKELFDVSLAEGNYFVKPEHFEITNTTEFLVTDCIYHGNYFDTNLRRNSKSIHVHLNEAQKVDSSIGIRPILKYIHLERQ